MNKTEVLKSLLDTLDAKSIELKELRNALLVAEKVENAEDVQDIDNSMNELKSRIIRKYLETNESKEQRNFLHDNVD